MDQGITEHFTHQDRTMAYHRHARAADAPAPSRGGRPFLLVHGIGMGRAVYAELAAELSAHGTVYSVDLPGFGDSPEPQTPLSIPETGDFMAAFIREQQLQDPVLVGHSMGGQVVAEIHARHPELSSTGVLIAPAVNQAERTAARQALRMVQDLAGESPKVLALGTAQYAKAGPRWFFKKMRQMLDHRIEESLPHIQADVMVLRGEKDRVCPRPWTQQITDLLPQGRMEEIPDRGHEAVIRTSQPAAEIILNRLRDRQTG